VTRQRRDPWFELELRDDPDDVRVLFRPGWTNDTEGMFLPLRETGWFATTFETRRALEGVTLTWGWIGVDDDLNLVECSAEGEVPGTGEFVDDVGQVTLARFTAGG